MVKRSSLFRLPVLLAGLVLLGTGCSQNARDTSLRLTPPRVVVVAPVLNLSDSQDIDPLKITDWVASEFQSFSGVTVVPVNRVLAELALWGQTAIQTPADAKELARAFDADATVVVAITEYDPYDPPVVGLVMQWYGLRSPAQRTDFDPVAASRYAADPSHELSAEPTDAPRWQVQRVFNAADERLLDRIRDFAAERAGHQSPYGWRKYTKSQEAYVRYCSWEVIRSILLLETANRNTNEPDEAQT